MSGYKPDYILDIPQRLKSTLKGNMHLLGKLWPWSRLFTSYKMLQNGNI